MPHPRHTGIVRGDRHPFSCGTAFRSLTADWRSYWSSDYADRGSPRSDFARSSVSFFDEPEETRTAPRTAPRRRRPTGGGVDARRARRTARRSWSAGSSLAVVIVVAIVLIAVLVNSCEVSARNSALKDYNNNVAVDQRHSRSARARRSSACCPAPTEQPDRAPEQPQRSAGQAASSSARPRG